MEPEVAVKRVNGAVVNVTIKEAGYKATFRKSKRSLRTLDVFNREFFDEMGVVVEREPNVRIPLKLFHKMYRQACGIIFEKAGV